MHYIRITALQKENIDSERICCAMSGKQSLVKVDTTTLLIYFNIAKMLLHL